MQWIVLALMGWLGYALVRGLWVIVYLGAPLYDWTWYVPLIVLLIGLPIWIVGLFPRRSTLFMMLVWTVVGYTGFGQDFVRRLTAAVNGPQGSKALVVSFSRPASAMLYGTAAADALLDARGVRGWLWLAWAILSGFIVRRFAASRRQ